MEEEMDSLQKNKMWQLVKPPTGRKIVGCKWVFKKNEGLDRDNTRYKARLVAKGYNQVEGVDFHDAFSPLVKHTPIRALLALVVLYNFELKQLNVKVGFLHGDLDEDNICNNRKASRSKARKIMFAFFRNHYTWYKKFDSLMLSIGFVQSKYDSFVYLHCLDDGSFFYLLSYVEDMLIAAKDPFEIDRLKIMFNSKCHLVEKSIRGAG
ncbi:Retrovirus-related Pol polyprotein from transposon TNT 1-94 [Gossypium australe]|uniref:Retrovirus-related Pol polyprotein from transposon TNT 1-94 n=1 Tax=Gossypium australe TaxID=47621 RepID=A0A5B6VXM9_9ROSI|nr:Retrovirus-related Pol polyprotein from transposon TNT 1-94 [Gossypium australe]